MRLRGVTPIVILNLQDSPFPMDKAHSKLWKTLWERILLLTYPMFWKRVVHKNDKKTLR